MKQKNIFFALVIFVCVLIVLIINGAGSRWQKQRADIMPLSDKVKAAFGMQLSNLEISLKLTPVVTGEEPFMLTFSVPLQIDMAGYGYYPDDANARNRVLHLFDNGNDADGYDISRETNGAYIIRWNTTFASYGTHILQVRLDFPWRGSHSVEGPERVETITNILQWDYGESGFGRWTAFRGALQVTSANYSIIIYDTNKYLMARIDGHTDKGLIDEVWNVHPTNKYAWSDDDLRAEVYVTPTIIDTNGHIRSNAPTVYFPYP